ncbi:hypothetical protein PCIT_b0952 [Pseudoalteromonas citrea]|uniref:Uncharacterized protein n=1 Tax=Pseudoalteromonas citrea TaxID=43655 RepID=A0AAD4AF71_9GAMM|nr:hypothetical protein PCIT_b0952 [Pseudoalteromonas citrea]
MDGCQLKSALIKLEFMNDWPYHAVLLARGLVEAQKQKELTLH